jgi:predicted patatin/cPLA2 family phospholipase
MKQFREIIYTKFPEISQNLTKFRERKYNEISQNFAKLKSLSSLFRILRNKKILFRDHPTWNYFSHQLQTVGN